MIIQGDARHIPLSNESVQCVVTSPPYWGLRDFGIEPSVWGSEEGCGHEWGDEILNNATNHTDKRRWNHTRNGRDEEQPVEKRVAWLRTEVPQGKFCQICGAWAGVLGLEPTPELYGQHIVEVFREVWRVLRKDGTCWVNLGDSYNSPNTHSGKADKVDWGIQRVLDAKANWGETTKTLKPKDLCGVPWRVAFALQADGWYLRSDIIWSKPNPMPESVTDRPTKSHEYIFLLTKSENYFCDMEAIREPGVEPERDRLDRIGGSNGHTVRHSLGGMMGASNSRNKRSVWTVATQPYPDAHFATFPENLIKPCILAGTSQRGACVECGAPYVRLDDCGDSWDSDNHEDMQSLPQRTTAIELLPDNSQDMQRLRSGTKTAATVRELGTRESNSESISAQQSRESSGTQESISSESSGPCENVGGQPEILPNREGQATENFGISSTRQNGNGQVERANTLQQKAGQTEGGTGQFLGGGLACDTETAEEQMLLLQKEIHENNSANDRPRDSFSGRRAPLAAEHSGSMSKLQFSKTNAPLVASVKWRPSCKCGTTEVRPCIILDPFAGSGTTLKVSQDLGRHGIALDLKLDYLKMGKRRSAQMGLAV